MLRGLFRLESAFSLVEIRRVNVLTLDIGGYDWYFRMNHASVHCVEMLGDVCVSQADVQLVVVGAAAYFPLEQSAGSQINGFISCNWFTSWLYGY